MRTEQILLAINIAREKSITKAAEMMFISQPNASIMLKSLEKELGFPLFRRQAGNIVLTEEGAEFVDYAISIERSLNAISQISKPVKHIDFRILTLKSDIPELAFERLCEKYSSGDYAIRLCYQVIPNTEDAARMIERGQSDIAIVVCRKNLYEAYSRYASNKHLETAKISETLLYLTCGTAHPIIQSGRIRYELFEEYPAFTSIPVSSSDNYVPSFLMKYGITVKNAIVMDPCDTRYRLLQKMNGFLISMPISDAIKAEYDLKSLPVEDSNIIIFALYRKNPQKEELLNEYIRYCKKMFESGMQSIRQHDSAEYNSTRIPGRK